MAPCSRACKGPSRLSRSQGQATATVSGGPRRCAAADVSRCLWRCRMMSGRALSGSATCSAGRRTVTLPSAMRPRWHSSRRAMIALSVARPCRDRALHHDAVARHGIDHEAQFLRQDLAARARHAPGGEVQQDALHEQGIGCVRQQVAGRIWARRTAPRQGRSCAPAARARCWRSCRCGCCRASGRQAVPCHGCRCSRISAPVTCPWDRR